MSLIPVSHIITTVDTDSFIKGWREDPNILRTKLMWKYLIAPIFFYQYSFTLCCILSNRFSTYRGWEGGGLMSHNAACQWKTGVKKGIAGECVTWHATTIDNRRQRLYEARTVHAGNIPLSFRCSLLRYLTTLPVAIFHVGKRLFCPYVKCQSNRSELKHETWLGSVKNTLSFSWTRKPRSGYRNGEYKLPCEMLLFQLPEKQSHEPVGTHFGALIW